MFCPCHIGKGIQLFMSSRVSYRHPFVREYFPKTRQTYRATCNCIAQTSHLQTTVMFTVFSIRKLSCWFPGRTANVVLVRSSSFV